MPRLPRSTAAHRDSEGPIPSLRIIGGELRGRSLKYSGDERTRPMKDRVREAVFNLVAVGAKGKHAVDLFAGTGALGLEAISRGATRATLLERHFPTAKIIEENIANLNLKERATVVPGDAFIWVRRASADQIPWLIFCSPPYDFYIDRAADMHQLLTTLLAKAPADSMFVVESDQRFDTATLPLPDAWDVRDYSPARISILRSSPAAEIRP